MPQRDRLHEKALHAFWKHSNYFSHTIQSDQGHRIEVVQRGKYNVDAGPDFIDAVLKIDGRLVEGDVEIHLNARDWLAHGHDRDPAYNRVILHLALDSSPGPATLLCENGRRLLQHYIPEAVVQHAVKPSRVAVDSLILPFCPLAEQTPDKIAATVLLAGKLRFEEKTARLKEEILQASWDQLLYRGVAEALGYAINQRPFRQLADCLPIDLLFAEMHQEQEANHEVLLTALLFGVAGFLETPSQLHADAEVIAYLQPRRDVWQRLRHVLQLPVLPEASWQFYRLRPTNFPTRRIAALAKLIEKFYRFGMLETLVAVLETKKQHAKAVIRELRRLFTVPAPRFWQAYYDFKSRAMMPQRRTGEALIGQRKADEIIVNIVLPLLNLYAGETRNATLRNAVLEVYLAYPPLESNKITRAMRRQLSLGNAVARSGGTVFQQGQLHLHKAYCIPLRCEACLHLTPPVAPNRPEIAML